MSEPVRICVTTTSRTYDVLVGAGLLDELGRADEAASLRASLRADYPESEAARQLPPAP